MPAMNVRICLLPVICLSVLSLSCQSRQDKDIPYLPGELPLLIVVPVDDTGTAESFEIPVYEWRWKEETYGWTLILRLMDDVGAAFYAYTSRHLNTQLSIQVGGSVVSSPRLMEPLRTEFILSAGTRDAASPLFAIFPLPDGE